MHPADIQAALKKRDITQKELAAELGVSEMQISRVVNKGGPSERIMRAISRAINKDPHAVFPEYFFRTRRRKKPNVANG